jgi:hypothetical protein
MDAEPQPEIDRARLLSSALLGFRLVWMGLFVGAMLITLIMVGLVASELIGSNELGDIAYIFIVPVPVGLFAAYIILPMLSPKIPEALKKDGKAIGGNLDPLSERAGEEELYKLLPIYASQFFLRMGLLEGPVIITLIGFLLTANWALLVLALPMFAAMAIEMPTHARYRAWTDSAKRRIGEDV